MARLTGPDDRTLTRSGLPGTALRNAGGYTATAYAASTGSTLADIINVDNSAIPGSVLTVGDDSQLPLFLFPVGVDTVWLEITGIPGRFPVYARVDDRLDTLETVGGPHLVKAGVPADSDFSVPKNGMMAINSLTTPPTLYVRVAGVWTTTQ